MLPATEVAAGVERSREIKNDEHRPAPDRSRVRDPVHRTGAAAAGPIGLEADHRVVDLCAAISSAEPFAT